MSQENVELARRIWEQGLLFDARSGALDPDFEVHDHDLPDARVGFGRPGFEKWTQAWAEAWQSWDIENENYVDAGDQVVVLTRVRGRGKGSGAQVEQRGGFVISLRGNKVIRLDYFASQAEALAAVGCRSRRCRRRTSASSAASMPREGSRRERGD
jgi:ketosteroid isomerase-like protein